MGLRERKKEHTRELLVDTALRLFSAQGYDDTTVDMIAAEAMVSSRTFFRYFETKDAVLAEPGSQIVDRTVERLRADGARQPSLHELVRLMVSLVLEREASGLDPVMGGARQHPELVERWVGWRQRWSAELAAGLASLEGRPVPTFHESVVSATAIVLVGAAMDERLRGVDASPGLSELTERALEIVCEQAA